MDVNRGVSCVDKRGGWHGGVIPGAHGGVVGGSSRRERYSVPGTAALVPVKGFLHHH